VGVTLAHRKGYFQQRLDEKGNQTEAEDPWRPEDFLTEEKATTAVTIEGRSVRVRAWRFAVEGISGHVVPVFLLDTNLPENSPWDRALTDHLYGGDDHYRICQEAILGLGGCGILRALGYTELQGFHMNEGHSSFLALALLERELGRADLNTATEGDIEAVRGRCIFTTHTPVPAGHDQFPRSLVNQVLGEHVGSVLESVHCCPRGILNMTLLALRFSRYINGVAMHHGEISHDMFPDYPIHAITNGVHAQTWTAPPFCELYDRHIPEWRYDNQYFRYIFGVPLDEIREAHRRAKKNLIDQVNAKMGVQLEEAPLTLGFARRAATYKRADFLFSDLDRLKRIAQSIGPLQIVYGGKAHPHDEGGKELIRRVFEAAKSWRDYRIKVVYVPNYDWSWGRLITSVAVNASFFNTQRMLSQYLRNAYQSIEIDLSAAEAESRTGFSARKFS
jgi:glycogen phosphorylase